MSPNVAGCEVDAEVAVVAVSLSTFLGAVDGPADEVEIVPREVVVIWAPLLLQGDENDAKGPMVSHRALIQTPKGVGDMSEATK